MRIPCKAIDFKRLKSETPRALKAGKPTNPRVFICAEAKNVFESLGPPMTVIFPLIQYDPTKG